MRYHKPRYWPAGVLLLAAAAWVAYRVTVDPHHGSRMGFWLLNGSLIGVVLLALWQSRRSAAFSTRHIVLAGLVGSAAPFMVFATKLGINPLLVLMGGLSFGGGALILPLALSGAVLLWPFTRPSRTARPLAGVGG